MTYFGNNAQGKETLFNVGEKLYFETEVEELDQRTQAWKPYISNDLQVELVMLDPWVRVPLTLTDSKTGKYRAEFYVNLSLKIGTIKGRNLSVQDHLQKTRIQLCYTC